MESWEFIRDDAFFDPLVQWKKDFEVLCHKAPRKKTPKLIDANCQHGFLIDGIGELLSSDDPSGYFCTRPTDSKISCYIYDAGDWSAYVMCAGEWFAYFLWDSTKSTLTALLVTYGEKSKEELLQLLNDSKERNPST